MLNFQRGHGKFSGLYLCGGFRFSQQDSGRALPFKLETTNLRTINPTLGASALNAMALAGAIALVLVCLFMLIVYRVPGFVACIALLGQVALSLACVSGFFNFVPSFTLTLPGIAA